MLAISKNTYVELTQIFVPLHMGTLETYPQFIYVGILEMEK